MAIPQRNGEGDRKDKTSSDLTLQRNSQAQQQNCNGVADAKADNNNNVNAGNGSRAEEIMSKNRWERNGVNPAPRNSCVGGNLGQNGRKRDREFYEVRGASELQERKRSRGYAELSDLNARNGSTVTNGKPYRRKPIRFGHNKCPPWARNYGQGSYRKNEAMGKPKGTINRASGPNAKEIINPYQCTTENPKRYGESFGRAAKNNKNLMRNGFENQTPVPMIFGEITEEPSQMAMAVRDHEKPTAVHQQINGESSQLPETFGKRNCARKDTGEQEGTCTRANCEEETFCTSAHETKRLKELRWYKACLLAFLYLDGIPEVQEARSGYMKEEKAVDGAPDQCSAEMEEVYRTAEKLILLTADLKELNKLPTSEMWINLRNKLFP